MFGSARKSQLSNLGSEDEKIQYCIKAGKDAREIKRLPFLETVVDAKFLAQEKRSRAISYYLGWLGEEDDRYSFEFVKLQLLLNIKRMRGMDNRYALKLDLILKWIDSRKENDVEISNLTFDFISEIIGSSSDYKDRKERLMPLIFIRLLSKRRDLKDSFDENIRIFHAVTGFDMEKARIDYLDLHDLIDYHRIIPDSLKELRDKIANRINDLLNSPEEIVPQPAKPRTVEVPKKPVIATDVVSKAKFIAKYDLESLSSYYAEIPFEEKAKMEQVYNEIIRRIKQGGLIGLEIGSVIKIIENINLNQKPLTFIDLNDIFSHWFSSGLPQEHYIKPILDMYDKKNKKKLPYFSAIINNIKEGKEFPTGLFLEIVNHNKFDSFGQLAFFRYHMEKFDFHKKKVVFAQLRPNLQYIAEVGEFFRSLRGNSIVHKLKFFNIKKHLDDLEKKYGIGKVEDQYNEYILEEIGEAIPLQQSSLDLLAIIVTVFERSTPKTKKTRDKVVTKIFSAIDQNQDLAIDRSMITNTLLGVNNSNRDYYDFIINLPKYDFEIFKLAFLDMEGLTPNLKKFFFSYWLCNNSEIEINDDLLQIAYSTFEPERLPPEVIIIFMKSNNINKNSLYSQGSRYSAEERQFINSHLKNYDPQIALFNTEEIETIILNEKYPLYLYDLENEFAAFGEEYNDYILSIIQRAIKSTISRHKDTVLEFLEIIPFTYKRSKNSIEGPKIADGILQKIINPNREIFRIFAKILGINRRAPNMLEIITYNLDKIAQYDLNKFQELLNKFRDINLGDYENQYQRFLISHWFRHASHSKINSFAQQLLTNAFLLSRNGGEKGYYQEILESQKSSIDRIYFIFNQEKIISNRFRDSSLLENASDFAGITKVSVIAEFLRSNIDFRFLSEEKAKRFILPYSESFLIIGPKAAIRFLEKNKENLRDHLQPFFEGDYDTKELDNIVQKIKKGEIDLWDILQKKDPQHQLLRQFISSELVNNIILKSVKSATREEVAKTISLLLNSEVENEGTMFNFVMANKNELLVLLLKPDGLEKFTGMIPTAGDGCATNIATQFRMVLYSGIIEDPKLSVLYQVYTQEIYYKIVSQFGKLIHQGHEIGGMWAGNDIFQNNVVNSHYLCPYPLLLGIVNTIGKKNNQLSTEIIAKSFNFDDLLEFDSTFKTLLRKKPDLLHNKEDYEYYQYRIVEDASLINPISSEEETNIGVMFASCLIIKQLLPRVWGSEYLLESRQFFAETIRKIDIFISKIIAEEKGISLERSSRIEVLSKRAYIKPEDKDPSRKVDAFEATHGTEIKLSEPPLTPTSTASRTFLRNMVDEKEEKEGLVSPLPPTPPSTTSPTLLRNMAEEKVKDSNYKN